MILITNSPDNRQAPFFIFLFFALIVVLYHFFAYFGHYGYDDMQYAEIAVNLLKGQFDYDHSFSYRSTIVFLTALSYYFLGINDFASALPSIIISISLLYIIFITLRKYGTLQTIAGLSATVFISVFLFYTDKIMADIYVAFFLLLAVYLIDKYRFGIKRKALIYSFLFTLSLFLAFLSKETAVLFLPLLLVLFIIDLSLKREIKFWIYSFIMGIGILVIYLIIVWIITGDPLRRFEVLAQFNQGQIYTYSYDNQPLVILLKRLFFDLFAKFISEGIFVLYILILPVFFTKGFRELFRINSSFSLWMVSSLVLLLSVNFMTISPFSYHPVPTDPRHSLFIIPIAAIAASFVLKDFLYEKRYKYPLLIFFAIISFIAFLTDRSGFYYVYFALTLLFLSYLFVRTRKNIMVLFVILFMTLLSVKPLVFVRYSNSVVKYNMQKQIVFDYFIYTDEKCYVFTDPMQKRTGRYYAGFDDSAPCIFVDYTRLDADHFDEDYKKYLFLNWHTQHYSNTLHQLPFFAKNIDSKLAAYAEVLDRRDQKILTAITEKPMTLAEITAKKFIYRRHNGQEVVRYFEEPMVRKHLESLVKRKMAAVTAVGLYSAKN